MQPAPSQGRRLVMNSPSEQYPSNAIKSTSTNLLTFVPLNLFGQLKNLANQYFIIIAILQVIPSISVTGGKPTILLPLSFVMLTVLVKDAYEQFYRYLKDRKQNQRVVSVFNGTLFADATCESLRVGQVIRLLRNDVIPCDALVLSTSDPEGKSYVETKGLDGQTNLKVRKAFTCSSRDKQSRDWKNDLRGKQYPIECEAPNAYLQRFSGSIKAEGETIPLSPENLLLRGCNIRNVHSVICLCLYTGPDTKLVLNSVKFEQKRSALMAQVNTLVVQIFIWQLVIALIVAFLNVLLESSYASFVRNISSSSFWITMLSWWLMMTYFVPISLMVTMEMVKLFQGKVLGQDSRGYSPSYECFASANCTSVNQNLGQISLVFTDKTGTLTKNQMHFKKIFSNGRLYGEGQKDTSEQFKRRRQGVEMVSFDDKTFDGDSPAHQNILKVLALCHDIYVQKESDGVLTYNSGSPDEIALINFAKLYGKVLLGEQSGSIIIADGMVRPVTKRYQKLGFLEFNSDRKRMSVLVRDPITKQIQLLTKGADSAVAALLRNNQPMLASLQTEVDRLSVQGLRTLMLGRRVISEEEYQTWRTNYVRAASAISNRQQLLNDCYDSIQRNLELVGATAIEDRLQDDVVNTIRTMRQAGMKFFILTGDKKQTAINIGRSCGLVQPNAVICDIPDYDDQNVTEWRAKMLTYQQITGEKVYLLNASKEIPNGLPLHQTICYRCTPNQKKKIVEYAKKNGGGRLTMAVGDGANDVNMITAADVGVGVKGKEGTEAARVADYVVGEFQHIRLLSLYYGRQWYVKNCRLVSYNFFKNWYHVSSVIVYGIFTYFSGVIIFDIYMYELFNVFFAAVPIIAYAVFDEEYTSKESFEMPQLYKPGIDRKEFNMAVYTKAIGLGILYGLTSILLIFCLLEANVLDSQGKTGSLYQSGSVLFANIIFVANLRILVMSRGLRPFLLFAVYGSIGFYWLFYYIYAQGLGGLLELRFKEQWQTPAIFFVHAILLFSLIFLEYAYRKYLQFSFRLSNEQKAVEMLKNIANYSVSFLPLGSGRSKFQ